MRLAAEILVRASTVAATVWVTRSLGVTAFGSFVLALSFGLMVAELADLGINALVVPLTVRSSRNLGALLRLKLAMTAPAILIGMALVPPAAAWLGVEPLTLILATAHFLGATWIEIAGSALRSAGRRLDEAVLLSGFRLMLLALVLMTPAERGVFGVALAYALSSLVGVGAALGLLARLVLPPGPEPLSAREILRLALPLGANGYLAILSTRVEILMLQSLASAGIVGLFSGALRIVESLLTLPAAIAAGALPALSRDVSVGARGAAQRTFGAVVWVGTPAALGLAFLAPDVLRLLGPGFVEGASTLRILALALLLCFANTALFHLLIAAGQTAVIPKLTALRVAVALVLGGPFVAGFGLNGAAASFTFAEAFLCSALVHRARSLVDVEILRPVRWALLASGPMMALLALVSWPLPWSVGASVVLFGLMAATILSRGTEAGGLA